MLLPSKSQCVCSHTIVDGQIFPQLAYKWSCIAKNGFKRWSWNLKVSVEVILREDTTVKEPA